MIKLYGNRNITTSMLVALPYEVWRARDKSFLTWRKVPALVVPTVCDKQIELLLSVNQRIRQASTCQRASEAAGGWMKQLQTLPHALCQQVISTTELQNPVFTQVLLFLRGSLNKRRKIILSEKKQNALRAQIGIMALNTLQSHVYLPAVCTKSNRKELVDRHLRSYGKQ